MQSGSAKAVGSREENKDDAIKDVVVLTNAWDLVVSWMKNTSGDADNDSEEEPASVQPAARPPRVGLGAKYLPQKQVAIPSPLEKKLRAKLKIPARNGGHHGQTHSKKRSLSDEDDKVGDDSGDEGLESRSSAFQRRSQFVPHTSLQPDAPQGSRKRKKKHK